MWLKLEKMYKVYFPVTSIVLILVAYSNWNEAEAVKLVEVYLQVYQHSAEISTKSPTTVDCPKLCAGLPFLPGIIEGVYKKKLNQSY